MGKNIFVGIASGVAELVHQSINHIKKSDRKRLVGCIMVLIGLAISLTIGHEVRETLYISLVNSIKIVLSSVFGAVGIFGVVHKKIKKRTLLWLDFIWMISTSVAVVLGLTQAFLASADLTRSTLQGNILRSERKAEVALEDYLFQNCTSVQQMSAQEKCRKLNNIYRSLRGGDDLGTGVAIKSLCHPPYELSDPEGQYCIPLGYALDAAQDPAMKDSLNVALWKISSLLWSLLLSVILGLRMAKSVSELWWYDPNNETP